MDGVYHVFGVGKTCVVELVAAPGVLGPIAPVQHDVVDRNTSAAEFFQDIQNLLLRFVAFAALPIAHRPLRHNLRLTRQGTISTDYFVHIFTVDKVIVYLILHFAPPGLLALLLDRHGRQGAQTAIRYVSVGCPLYLQRYPLARFEMGGKLVAVRVPGRSPTLGNHQFIIYIHLYISGIVEDKTELSAFRWLYLTFISHL